LIIFTATLNSFQHHPAATISLTQAQTLMQRPYPMTTTTRTSWQRNMHATSSCACSRNNLPPVPLHWVAPRTCHTRSTINVLISLAITVARILFLMSQSFVLKAVHELTFRLLRNID
jgi:hypothetical protein